MGLLDTLFGEDPAGTKSQAMNQMIGGLLSRNYKGGLLGAGQVFADAPMNALKQQLMQSQVDENRSQAQERTLKARQMEAEAQRQAGIQRGLPGLFSQGGMTGGQAVPQEVGGVPMFSKPVGASPMQSVPGGFDVQRAMTELRMSPAEAKAYAEAAAFGKPKVARTLEVMRGGKPVTIQLDESGQELGGAYDQWKAPVFEGLGDRRVALDPVSLQQRGSFPINMSPAERDASARGWAGVGIQRDQANAGKVPAGYRPTAEGRLEYIPGGPADPNAAKRAAPTEFQGKSATYGARAQEADKIIGGLDGKYWPGAVNTKNSMESTPVVGGMLGSAANFALSDNGQKAEQAQRDFVNAVLRQESGAAISASEFENAKKQYFPQPFDSVAVKEQKARNRQLAVQGFLNNARPGSVDAVTGQTGGASGGWGIKEIK